MTLGYFAFGIGVSQEKWRYYGVAEKPYVLGLFKNVQMQGAQKNEP
jgi:hypothetical protein